MTRPITQLRARASCREGNTMKHDLQEGDKMSHMIIMFLRNNKAKIHVVLQKSGERNPTHLTASFSVRELRYLWTWAWFTPYRDSMRKTPPTPRVQKVCLSVGSGFKLNTQESRKTFKAQEVLINQHLSPSTLYSISLQLVQKSKQKNISFHFLPQETQPKYPADLLQKGDAVSFQGFPPDFRDPSSLLNSHHDDSQLPCEHHDRLKYVCPDDRFQSTLSETEQTQRKNISGTIILIGDKLLLQKPPSETH